jgi:hypothetical protein
MAAQPDPLARLRNLGPRSALMLRVAGIDSPARLRRVGALAAWRRVQAAGARPSLNLLYALVGALEDADWRQVRRTRRLELLLALEDAAAPTRGARQPDPLLALRNIGPAMRRDFDLLGIRSVRQLARGDADRLYARLQRLTGKRQDPCVWDTFAAAIHQARTGEALPWWHFTPQRKARQAQGDWPAPRHGPRRAAPAGRAAR